MQHLCIKHSQHCQLHESMSILTSTTFMKHFQCYQLLRSNLSSISFMKHPQLNTVTFHEAFSTVQT